MKTSDQVETEFRRDLQTLVNKWSARITAADVYPNYAVRGEDIRIIVEIPAGEDRAPCAIDLGSLFEC